jgi:aminoglycoside phosphotransferase (APT) family kinase protein
MRVAKVTASMSLSEEPVPDVPTGVPDAGVDAFANTVSVSGDRDHELAVVRQQIASALFPGGSSVPTQQLGRFTVERRLGAGAMGVVYAARDPDLDRHVAIKLVRPEVGGDQKAQRRLQREAMALAKVSHPNIVAIHEVGEHRGQVFLAMEHVRGQSLRAWQERERRSTSVVLAMYVQAGRGLSAAHAAGLVHRDFKPDNVLVDDEGRARVMDFGLVRGDDEARRQELARWQAPEEPSDALLTTHAHALVGTPAYMAPEQFQGGAADARSDQFAFCVALWEALYGERPFGGETVAQLSAHVLAGRVRPPAKGRRVPRWVRRACLRGLSLDPRQRWPSMNALVDLLAKDRTRALVQASVAWFFAALLIVGVVVPMSWGALVAVMSFSEPPSWQRRFDVESNRYATREKQGARAAELSRMPSPDFEALALGVKAVGPAEDGTAILPPQALRGLLDALSQVRRSIVLEDRTPDTTRSATEGQEVAAEPWDDETRDVLATLDAASMEITELAWSSDRKRLAVGSADGTVRSWDGSARSAWIVLSGHTQAISALAWTTDGTRLATASQEGTVRLWNGETGAPIAVLSGHTDAVRALAWTPDGSQLGTGSDDGTARLWDGATAAMLATLPGHDGPVRTLSWEPDGTRLVTVTSDGTARLWNDPATSELASILRDHGGDASRVPPATWVERACTILVGSTHELDADIRRLCAAGGP